MTNCISLAPVFEQALRRLCSYLLGGQLQARFDMSTFDDEQHTYEWKLIECGSVGCAVGQAPFAGVPKRLGEDWTEYSERVFGIAYEDARWDWCFGFDWAAVDNTPEGAGRRILWLLEHGLPEDHEDQRAGRAPRSYAGMDVTPEMLDWKAVAADG